MSRFKIHGYWDFYGIPWLYDYAVVREPEN